MPKAAVAWPTQSSRSPWATRSVTAAPSAALASTRVAQTFEFVPKRIGVARVQEIIHHAPPARAKEVDDAFLKERGKKEEAKAEIG